MADTISSTLPAWLVQRASPFEASSTSRDMQVGFQLAQQWQQNQQRAEQMAMQREAIRLKTEGNKFLAAGAIELGRLMEEGGRNNSYADPEFEGRLWSLGQQYPQLIDSEVFQGATKVTANAKAAKLRTEITDVTQQAITDRNQAAIQSRFDLLSQRLDSMTQLEGVKQDGRTALAELKNDLNMLRDQLKPTRPGEVFHDLSEADLAQMKSDLAALDKMYEKGRIKGKGGGLFSNEPKTTPEQEYQAERAAIQKKYDAKRTGAPRSVAAEPAKQDDFKAMYDALPSGAEYTDPNGVKRIKR